MTKGARRIFWIGNINAREARAEISLDTLITPIIDLALRWFHDSYISLYIPFMHWE